MESEPLMNLYDCVIDTAQRYPARIACVQEGEQYSYAELTQKVGRLADALKRAGIQAGDRIAHFGNPSVAYYVSFLAANSAGAIWVGLNPKYSQRELEHIISDARPKLIAATFSDEGDGAELEKALSERAEETSLLALEGAKSGWLSLQALALENQVQHSTTASGNHQEVAAIVYTSGTTGKPKGALVRHSSLIHAGKIYNDQYPVTNADHLVSLCNLPINHVGCLCDVTATTVCARGTLVFMDKFEPEKIPGVVDQHGVTVLGQVPTMWRYILETKEFEQASLSSLEWAVWSGAPMPLQLAERLVAKGLNVSNCYGMSETTGSVAFTKSSDSLKAKTESIGYPIEPENLRLWGGGERIDKAGVPGEIQVRGPLIFSGYFNMEAATNACMEDREWFKTGDLGMWTAAGALTLVGRLKEMFKSGGYNVYPREIELVLEGHESITVAAVISIPDEIYEEVGCAFVTSTNPSVSTAELTEWCRKRLANYKVPKRIMLVDNLPLLPIGKVDKAALRTLTQSVKDQ